MPVELVSDMTEDEDWTVVLSEHHEGVTTESSERNETAVACPVGSSSVGVSDAP